MTLRRYRTAPDFWGFGISRSPGNWHLQVGSWVFTTEPGHEQDGATDESERGARVSGMRFTDEMDNEATGWAWLAEVLKSAENRRRVRRLLAEASNADPSTGDAS